MCTEPVDQIDFYDRYGELYSKLQQEFENGNFAEDRRIMRRMLTDRAFGGRVFEMGCGAGHDLSTWIDLGATEVIGSDPSHIMIDIACERREVLRNQGHKVMMLPFSLPLRRRSTLDGKVDFLVARYSLHLADDMKELFCGIARLVRPGGWLVFSVPHPEYHAHLVREGRSLNGVLWSPLFGGKITVPNPVRDDMEQYYLTPARPYFDQMECVPYGERALPDLGGIPTGMVCAYRRKLE